MMLLNLPTADTHTRYLHSRMHGPQRHRLLHGYPLAAAMRPRHQATVDDVRFDPRAGRGLLVGVLPHPFCNPTVAGCGFCTFPHAKYDAGSAREVIAAVCREIGQRLQRQPELRGRPVSALYFGGGTANLSPAEPFRELCRTLARAFDLSRAEVTLEGVPVYFLTKDSLLLDILAEELPARHFRLSMGVQSFDEGQLERMGRLAFGTAQTFRQVVEQAHARGFTASADLLFNLPHQTPAEMDRDVDRAVELGLDHLGLYHLVPFPGENHLEVVEMKNLGHFRPASAVNPDVPTALDQILARMLARQPRDRYQTASELIIDLERSRLAVPVPSFADPDLARKDPWVRACVAPGEPTRLDPEATPTPGRRTPRQPEPEPEWIVRYRNRAGRPFTSRLSTEEVVERLQEETLPADATARRPADEEFQPLATFDVFRPHLPRGEEAPKRSRPVPAPALELPPSSWTTFAALLGTAVVLAGFFFLFARWLLRV